MTDATQVAYDEAEFPSLAEYDAKSGGSGGEDWPEHTQVEDGMYQLAVLFLTPPMENKFPNPKFKQDNPKPIRFLFFTVVDSDDPDDIGKIIRKKVTHSGHPKSSAYPFLSAAYGGPIPPEIRPTFAWLSPGVQMNAFLVTRPGDSGHDYQAWEAIRTVKKDDYKPVPPF
jgi:hypothetical protein